MFWPALFLFFVLLVISAFFSSSETAFLACNPYTLEYLESKGSKRARLVRRALSQIDKLLSTILIGNTLANAAAASVATTVFVSFIPNKNEAVLLATLATTLFVLFFGEINPKTYAAHNPLKTVNLVIHPIRLMMALFSPIVRVFSFLSRILFPSSRDLPEGVSFPLGEGEIRMLLGSGIRGLSTLRKRMISGILDIGSRPIKEIIVPRAQIKAIEVDSSLAQIQGAIRTAGYSRYPVYRGRLDNIEGLLHAKDIIPYLSDNGEFQIRSVIRQAFFVPESAPMEKVLVQMQDNAVHMAVIVDEFGSVEGIVTLEDIIEEIVGDIRDEHDDKTEERITRVDDGVYLIKGSASIKEINEKLPFRIPDTGDYTTLAGFFLEEFGRIPKEKDGFELGGTRFIVEKMNKRHISLIRIHLPADKEMTSR